MMFVFGMCVVVEIDWLCCYWYMCLYMVVYLMCVVLLYVVDGCSVMVDYVWFDFVMFDVIDCDDVEWCFVGFVVGVYLVMIEWIIDDEMVEWFEFVCMMSVKLLMGFGCVWLLCIENVDL